MDVNRRILLVDDEAINLELFDVMLSKLGFEIEKAEDGEEALEKAVEFRPDLIILDNIMPRMTGWEVTRALKQDDEYRAVRDTPIIMFSAMDEVRDKVEGLELGVDDYITKPFNFSEVLARIRAVLHRSGLSREVQKRERRIGVVEALNDDLIGFFRDLETPLGDLIEAAGSDSDGDLASRVRDTGASLLERIAELTRRIEDVESRRAQMKEDELSTTEVQSRLQQRFGEVSGD